MCNLLSFLEPMRTLHTLEGPHLMDLLSKYTTAYARLVSDGSSQEEYLKCKEAIKAIQLEIEVRQNKQSVLPEEKYHSASSADQPIIMSTKE